MAKLNAHAPGDPNLASLPSGSSITDNTGTAYSQVVVWEAQLKALGYLSATGTENDGDAGFATDIDPSLLVGVALHELTHAMGRAPYGSDPDIMEFFRFTAAGQRLFSGNTGTASYFSLDGGNTTLANYGVNSDPSDFLNDSLTPGDPFDEYYDSSTLQSLTPLDLTQLDVLGFNVSAKHAAYVRYDFNGDGVADILWRNTSGAVQIWDMNASGGHTSVNLATASTSWRIAT